MSPTKYRNTREIILDILREGESRSCSELAKKAKLTRSQVSNSLMLAWRGGHVLRTAKPIYETERLNKGRGGIVKHTRPYHLYLSKLHGRTEAKIDGRLYVPYDDKYLDPRGGGSVSKASLILGFLRNNPGV